MMNASAELTFWLVAAPNRYFTLTGHPGHGTHQVRVRLYELHRSGDKTEAQSVTEDVLVGGDRSNDPIHLATGISRALERWSNGEYDSISVTGMPPSGDSGPQKKVII